jgi:hypothetical protein
VTGLPDHHIRLAVADCLRDPDPVKCTLSSTLRHLWREDPKSVTALYEVAVKGDMERERAEGAAHGLLAERMAELMRAPLVRDRMGFTVPEIAAQADMDRETLACLMEHHGYLELVPYGRGQRRRLVTDAAFMGELGHNALPGTKRSPRLDGINRAVPFPVFYPEVVPSILWTLDWQGVYEAFRAIANKRHRIKFALTDHGHLPNAALAALCDCSARAIEKGRTGISPLRKTISETFSLRDWWLIEGHLTVRSSEDVTNTSLYNLQPNFRAA